MQIDEQELNRLLERAVGDLSAGAGGVMISLGHKLGLYRTMAGAGPLSATELARRSGCAERYVREWLNAQAAGGYVAYHPSSGTYELTPEQELILANPDGPAHIPPAWDVVASLWFDEEKAIEAFRSGEGIAWGDHDERLFCGVAAFFRSSYRSELVPNWLPALDGVVERLRAGGRVADVGCGHGHSTILMAEAFPESRFTGYDVHEGSVEAARANALEAGVTDRVDFQVASAKDYPARDLDLVCFFDCLHDMGDPAGAAAHARRSLGPDGTVMLVEPFANDRVEDNLNPIGRLYYASSTMLCCAHSLSEEVGLALGAQAGESRLTAVLKDAGFGHIRRATATPFNMIIEARA